MGHRPTREMSTIKLANNVGENLHDLGHSYDFLDTSPKAHPMKEKTRQIGLH